jgi:hypothetical protein
MNALFVFSWFVCFTMDAIASTAFGIEIDSQKQHDDPFVRNLEKIFKMARLKRIPIFLSGIFPLS